MGLFVRRRFLYLLAGIIILSLGWACTARPDASPRVESPGSVIGATSTPTSAPSPTPTETPAQRPSDVFVLEVVVDPPGAGFVVTIPAFGPYPAGSSVTLSVLGPRVSPYIFANWEGDASGAERSVTIVMDSDKQVVAHFINPFITPTPDFDR